MFKEMEFQFDGKSSNDFELKIVKFNSGGGVNTDSIGIPLSIEEEKIKRNPKPFFFGVETTPKLTFNLELAYIPNNGKTNQIITRQTLGAISKWLFKRKYSEFKILDTDYSNMIYNCIFTNPKQIEIGSYPYGLSIDVICDRPYGYRKQTITKVISGSSTFNIKNLGFDNDDIYPEIEFTTTSSSFTIINNTDDSNSMEFTSLTSNETVYIDNSRQEIISSTGNNRNKNFNFNWFKIVPDYYNSITVVGSGSVTFRIEFPIPS